MSNFLNSIMLNNFCCFLSLVVSSVVGYVVVKNVKDWRSQVEDEVLLSDFQILLGNKFLFVNLQTLKEGDPYDSLWIVTVQALNRMAAYTDVEISLAGQELLMSLSGGNPHAAIQGQMYANLLSAMANKLKQKVRNCNNSYTPKAICRQPVVATNQKIPEVIVEKMTFLENKDD